MQSIYDGHRGILSADVLYFLLSFDSSLTICLSPSLSYFIENAVRGMAAAGTSGFSKMEERGYFLLLDRLQCTLEDKIDIWKDYDKELSSDSSSSENNVRKKRREFLAERLPVAFDVCASLDYLHSNMTGCELLQDLALYHL